MPDSSSIGVEEWDEVHPRWMEFVRCMEIAAPEQTPFVLGDYARHLKCCLLVAVQDDHVVGFLRFGVQAIGAEEGLPPLMLGGTALKEAKIHAFAVQQESRGHGAGKALQTRAIAVARGLGCYQLASHSSYDREANCHLKLALGFCAHPEPQGGIRFLMPLQATVVTTTIPPLIQQ